MKHHEFFKNKIRGTFNARATLAVAQSPTDLQDFKEHLENYYATHDIAPTEGALATFQILREAGIKVVLDTGFYRKVVDTLLEKLNWRVGETIDGSIASDEVLYGRPASDMIESAMQRFGINNTKQVIKIGDTPSDLQEGRAAHCLFSFGVTNGTHTAAELSAFDNDGLFASLTEFRQFLLGEIAIASVQKQELASLNV